MTPAIQIDPGLQSGLIQLGLDDAPNKAARLQAYLALLKQWNKVYNLTALQESEWVVKHLLDSLSLLPWLKPGPLLDIGSGAGLPGLILAIADPAREVVLLDSNNKKTRFLTHATATLGLENVNVTRCRVESYAPGRLFSVVTSRAFASLAGFLRVGIPLCHPTDGVLLAMKGTYPTQELTELPAGASLQTVQPLRVPGLNAERHLVSMIPTREY